MSDKINFETQMKKLESLINEMESGDLNLEDSIKMYEDGIKLVNKCQTALQNAEQKVKILSESSEKLSLQDFDANNTDSEDDTATTT